MSTKFYHNKNGVPLKSQEDVINLRESNSISSVCLNYLREEILIGDRLGNLHVFSSDRYALLKKIQLAKHGIESLKLSPKGSMLGVVLTTGEVFLCDCSKNYQQVQNLEPALEDYSLKSWHMFKDLALIPDQLERSSLFEQISVPNASKIGSGERSGTINYKKFSIKQETAFKAITVSGSNTMHLLQVYKDDLTISKNVKLEYNVEGKLAGFKVHSSNDYVLALSNTGLLYVFKIINGDVRLKINVPA